MHPRKDARVKCPFRRSPPCDERARAVGATPIKSQLLSISATPRHHPACVAQTKGPQKKERGVGGRGWDDPGHAPHPRLLEGDYTVNFGEGRMVFLSLSVAASVEMRCVFTMGARRVSRPWPPLLLLLLLLCKARPSPGLIAPGGGRSRRSRRGGRVLCLIHL